MPGALAPVEVVLPILGMILHIGGITQWIQKERHMGVHFNHINSGSKHQLECLISCLLGQTSAEIVKKTVATPKLNLSLGDVLAVPPPDLTPEVLETPREMPSKWPYDNLVHCGAARLYAQSGSEWQVAFRSIDNRFHLNATMIDLSLGGCTIRTPEPFAVELLESVQVDFAMQGLHFLISGVTQAIYDRRTIGIQFNPASSHRREELALLIVELCASSNSQLVVG